MKKECKEKFKELDELSDSASGELRRKRGREFETLINNIFDEEEILLSPGYHTYDNKSEQIDGAVEVYHRIFLIETKWVTSNLAASELFAFIGKIENKFHGTLGVFISRNELKPNFLNALNKGRRQSVIVVHGKDIDLIFEKNVPLKDYIEFAYKQMSFNNITHISIEKYLKDKKERPISDSNTPQKKKKAISFLKTNILIKNKISETELFLKLQDLESTDKDIAFEILINYYSNLWHNAINNRAFLPYRNAELYLEIHSPSEVALLEISKTFYINIFFKDIEVYSRDFILKIFKSQFNSLPDKSKRLFEDKIKQAWNDNFQNSNYDVENGLTKIIEPHWKKITQETKNELANYYLDFFISSRLSKFPQKAFANYLLANEITQEQIENWLQDKVADSKTAYKKLSENKILFIAETYSQIAPYLDISPKNWVNYIGNIINNSE